MPIRFAVNKNLQPLPDEVNFVLLLIPKNKDISIQQLTTLRQARSLGVKIKLIGAVGPPQL